jgi:hypothetical protein
MRVCLAFNGLVQAHSAGEVDDCYAGAALHSVGHRQLPERTAASERPLFESSIWTTRQASEKSG